MAAKKSGEGTQTVFWWIVWISLTIASFFLASAFWTPLIAKHHGSIHSTRTAVLWVAAVFGTWIVILIPLIIVMYQKVDKAYDDARIRREKAAWRYRSVYVEAARRLLPEAAAKKIRKIPEIIEGGRLLTVILKSGRRIPNVFVSGEREILGVYDFTELPFEGKDVADVEPADEARLPAFQAAQWLRLDGVSYPD